MTQSIRSIADAIATQYSGITANGESISIGPTSLLPNTIPGRQVALIVLPPSGTLGVAPNAQRDDVYDFTVQILRDPIDVPARTVALYAWLDATRDVIYVHTSLGLGSVIFQALPVSVRCELDGETYGGSKYDVVEYVVRVQINEAIPTLGV